MFNVISVTRGWVGVQFAEKWRYVTLEWPLGIGRPYFITFARHSMIIMS